MAYDITANMLCQVSNQGAHSPRIIYISGFQNEIVIFVQPFVKKNTLFSSVSSEKHISFQPCNVTSQPKHPKQTKTILFHSTLQQNFFHMKDKEMKQNVHHRSIEKHFADETSDMVTTHVTT